MPALLSIESLSSRSVFCSSSRSAVGKYHADSLGAYQLPPRTTVRQVCSSQKDPAICQIVPTMSCTPAADAPAGCAPTSGGDPIAFARTRGGAAASSHSPPQLRCSRQCFKGASFTDGLQQYASPATHGYGRPSSPCAASCHSQLCEGHIGRTNNGDSHGENRNEKAERKKCRYKLTCGSRLPSAAQKASASSRDTQRTGSSAAPSAYTRPAAPIAA